MGDYNGSLNTSLSNHASDSISPPSLKEGRAERHDVFRSGASSPLLDTEPLPLDDHAHCPYCHQDFRKPRVLDCLHSMCEDCIIAQLDGRRDAQKTHGLMFSTTDCELEAPKVHERPTPPGVIRCPVCAQESHVGNDIRFVHGMLLDYVRINDNEETHTERRCRACKSEQSAVAFCKQCQSDLCSNCLTAHGTMRLFDGHEAITYVELDIRGETNKTVRPVMCQNHHLPYRSLCATCETLSCKSCLEAEHHNHKVIEVSELVSKAIQSEISKLASRVDRKWQESMSEWSSIPDRSTTLYNQYETAKMRMEHTFEEIAKCIDEVRFRKLAELDEARHKQEQAIEDLYRKMSLNEARVNDALSFTHRLLNNSNGMELIASRRKVIQQLNNLSHTMPALGIQVELEYHPLNKKQLETQLGTICGAVVGRMVSSSVKEQTGGAEELRRSMSAENNLNDHGKQNGAQAAAVSNLGAIGTERKKTGSRGSTNESFGGWPPCSNPPELPSATPVALKELATSAAPIVPPANQLQPSVGTSAASIYNNYKWPPSSNPAGNGQAPAPPNYDAFLPFNVPNPLSALNARQMALMLGNNPLPGNANLIMQAARLGNLAPSGVDPLILSSLTLGSNLGGNQEASASTNQRVSPQETLRVSELKIHSIFGTSSQGSSIRELHCPSGFCLSESDDILIADTNNHRVVVCGPPHPWKIGRPGTDDGMLCFPKKVVALRSETSRYVVLDKGADGKTRAQIFDGRGEFQKRVNLAGVVPRHGIEVSAATCGPPGMLIIVDTAGVIYTIDVDVPCCVKTFDVSSHLGEASDIAFFDKKIFITDFKHHCVHVFNMDGTFIRKMGEPSQTPYPIGIDISKNGDVLVADTHGNHLHIVVFNADGMLLRSFTHNEFRLSRCVGLRVAGSGHIVTLCKHNHTLFVFKPLYLH